MFKVQLKTFEFYMLSFGEYKYAESWIDVSYGPPTFPSEELAWKFIESLNEYGNRHSGNFRVVPA